ncbi:hypothetical protein E8E12_000663 [Didymella heteroderae]|uniref:Uncharacterized protein n=1 Tax=Didymella heteroderae TaxID=1769908 RepID=A0A9P4WFK2_9PLEO|nr:hypothetical protein E8E12_000663 [Didymella heteroderae]
MGLTWSHLLVILNVSIAFFSLALVAIAPAVIYLTAHGSHRMNQMWGEGIYQWYRGSAWDPSPFIRLTYVSTNEPVIYMAAAISILAGLAGIFGIFFKQKSSKPLLRKSTLVLQAIPGTVAFLLTSISFIYTQVVYDTNNNGKCDWRRGYYADTVFKCTREQAACNIVGYFILDKDVSDVQPIFDAKREICGETQTGRHLVAPLFVASVFMCALAVAKVFAEKRENRFTETADERIDRLARQEE